jgi:hypothetical protein
MARNSEGGVFLSFKAISFAVAVIGAVALSGSSAFAVGPNTTCPVANFKCALSFAQTKSLTDPSNPGQPSVGIGYLVFDSSVPPKPTIFVVQNKDGVLKTLATQVGTCSTGTAGAPGTLDFTAGTGPLLRFVTFNSGAELRFIDGSAGTTGVTVGSCRQ